MGAACSAVAAFFRAHGPIVLFAGLFVAFVAAFVAALIGGSNGAGQRRNAPVVDSIDLLSGLLELLNLFF